jgi:hypothetical protein
MQKRLPYREAFFYEYISTILLLPDQPNHLPVFSRNDFSNVNTGKQC